jgi:hypothetical protein
MTRHFPHRIDLFRALTREQRPQRKNNPHLNATQQN